MRRQWAEDAVNILFPLFKTEQLGPHAHAELHNRNAVGFCQKKMSQLMPYDDHSEYQDK